MSIKVSSYVWENYESTSSRKLMLLAIADHADDYGVAFPGVSRLAEKCNISKRQAQNIIAKLEEEGAISVDVHNGIQTSHGYTNRYYIIPYRRSREVDIRSETIRYNRESHTINSSQGVQETSPHANGMKKLSPQGMKNNSPQGVQETSPKPSGEPSGEPSDIYSDADAPNDTPSKPSPPNTTPSAENTTDTHSKSPKQVNDEYQEAVAYAFDMDMGGRAGRFVKLLRGQYERGNGKAPRSSCLWQMDGLDEDGEPIADAHPMTPAEICAARKWYTTTYPDQTKLPTTYETIFNRMLEFRAAKDYERFMRLGEKELAKRTGDVSPDTPQADALSDAEDRRKNRAEAAALTEIAAQMFIDEEIV